MVDCSVLRGFNTYFASISSSDFMGAALFLTRDSFCNHTWISIGRFDGYSADDDEIIDTQLLLLVMFQITYSGHKGIFSTWRSCPLDLADRDPFIGLQVRLNLGRG